MSDVPRLTADALRQFTGAAQSHRHSINRKILYTEGVKFLAESGSAYWLLDEIALAQVHRNVVSEAFQHWTLRVNADRSAQLTCNDGNGRIVFTRRIPYTDFPLDELALYCTDSVIMLPSEY